MKDHYERITLAILVIITIWSTYQFGYNKGFNEAMQTMDARQNTTLNALQLSNDYQQLYLQCMDRYPIGRIKQLK